MQAVIIHDDIHNPVAVVVVHLEQVHRRIVHAQQVVDACCIHSRQVVVMHRNLLGERGSAEVEHIAFVVVLHIREKADETAQSHHKHQMEIGKLLAATVQPLQAVHHKLVKVRVALFVARAVIDKLGEEKQYAQLRGVEGNGGEGNAYSRIAYMVQLLLRSDVEFQVEYRQRLEKLLLQFSPLRLWDAHHTRQPPFLFRQEVHNEFILPVFYRAEHHGLSLQQHVGKDTKKREQYKINLFIFYAKSIITSQKFQKVERKTKKSISFFRDGVTSLN